MAAMAPRLDVAPFPGQGASGEDSHVHAPQHSEGFRTAAAFRRPVFVLIILFFAFPKSSFVFTHISNPCLINCSISEVHVKP